MTELTKQEKVAAPSPFTKDNPLLQYAWDSTSLGLLKTCPFKYYLTIVKGYRQKLTPSPLWWGIMLHKAFEVYIPYRAEGNNAEGIRIAIRTITEIYAGEYKGYRLDDKRRSLESCIRAIIWFDECFKNSDIEFIRLPSGAYATELSFRIAMGMDTPDGTDYFLTGHFDAIIRFALQLYVLDYKSTVATLPGQFFKQFTPDNQVSLYTLAGQTVLTEPVAGVLICGIQTAVGFTRFELGAAPRSKDLLESWFNDLIAFIHNAEYYAERQYWPKNDKACNMYSGCEFREVCSKSPMVQSSILAEDFRVEFWNPLESR